MGNKAIILQLSLLIGDKSAFKSLEQKWLTPVAAVLA